MFGKKKTIQKLEFSREEKKPVIRCSICNGEQVGGLKNRATGEFEEVMLIRTPADLEEFRETYGIEGEIKTIY